MSGLNDSKMTEYWNNFNTAIQQYLDSIGINKIKYNEEVDSILSATREQIFGMSPQTLGEHAFLLAQYSACIQKEINNHSSKLTWAEHNLRIRFGQIASNYGTQYTSYQERQDMALKDDSVCKELNRMVLVAKTRIKQLDFMATRISAMQKTLTDLQMTKRNYNG